MESFSIAVTNLIVCVQTEGLISNARTEQLFPSLLLLCFLEGSRHGSRSVHSGGLPKRFPERSVREHESPDRRWEGKMKESHGGSTFASLENRISRLR
jgi:hypothetical protein